MRTLSILCCFASVFLLSAKGVQAQPSIRFANASMVVSATETHQTLDIPLTVEGTLTTAQTVNLSFSRNEKTEKYSLPATSQGVPAGAASIKVQLTIEAGVLKEADTVSISFTDPLTSKLRSMYVYIKPMLVEDTDGYKEGRIMLLNAYNFDFGGNLEGSSYVGHLNISSRAMGETEKWAFNTGIMRINYGQKDTTLTVTPARTEYYFINYFDTASAGAKYLRRLSKYRTVKKNQVWSFYFQPMYQLNDPKQESRIYIHGHLELLASKYIQSTIATQLSLDTLLFTSPLQNGLVIRQEFKPKYDYTVNSLAAYFGGGVTYDMKLWNKGEFFIQGTVGATSNKPAPSSTDLDASFPPGNGPKNSEPARNWFSYFLVRANYIQKLSETAQIVVGVDIRGFLNDYAPLYGAYAGLNVGLDAIGKILTDKK